MNNYNNLINKPTINGRELIGHFTISEPSPDELLPKVTAENVGEVLMVSDDGKWITGTVKGGAGFNGGNTLNIITNVEEVTNNGNN